jgi:hypothetical protein
MCTVYKKEMPVYIHALKFFTKTEASKVNMFLAEEQYFS